MKYRFCKCHLITYRWHFAVVDLAREDEDVDGFADWGSVIEVNGSYAVV